jgi:hypothetical protein
MSNIKSEINFPNSGLNYDDAYEYMGVGDSQVRWHIQVSHDGSVGIIENMKGNHLAKYELSLSNVYRVGGSTYDRLNRCIYFFVFSQPFDTTSSGDYEYDNKLLKFNEDTETIELIFDDPKNYFGINPNYVVKDCNILGDWLFFNPRVSEPKMIDVVMAKNYTDYLDYDPLSTYVLGNKVKYFGGLFSATGNVAINQTPCTNTSLWHRVGDCYQDYSDINFDSEFRYAFNTIKHIPLYRPICSYGSDTSRSANNVAQKVFQFTHRYKYFDDSYSKFSNYSDVTLPQNSEVYNGEIVDASITNNYIKVQIQLHSPALIKEVEIAFREVGMDWKRAKIINRQEQSTLDDRDYTFNFYNTDSAYVVLEKELFEEQFDSVPRWAQAQELINKNILTYGGVTEGFDNLDKDKIDVTLTPELIPITEEGVQDTVLRDNVLSGDVTRSIIPLADGYSYQTVIDLAPTFIVGVVLGNEYSITLNGTKYSHVLTVSDVVSDDALANGIATFIYNVLGAGYPNFSVQASGATVVMTQNYTYLLVSESIFYTTTGAISNSLTKYRGFKTGAWHPMCLFYYDKALRRCDAQTSKENIDGAGYSINGTTVYIPMFNELSPLADTSAKWNVNWQIEHAPPDYAKWWRWGYAGNALCSEFVQYTVSAVTGASPWTTIDITPLQTLTAPTDGSWNEYPQSNIKPYQWTKGDRVRFITELTAGPLLGDLVDGVYDYEIVKLDEDTNKLYVQYFDPATINVGANTIVEIYTPRKTDVKTIYYEFGELFPIIEDSGGNLVHGGSSQNQDLDLSLAATGTFSNGDVYHIIRTPSKPIATTTGFFMESQWYSDFFESDMYDQGRPGVETAFNQRTLNIIRFSNQYLQNTGINGLTTFEGDNYKEINDIYGSIQAIMEVGNTLKVYMEKKSASILIGRQEYTDTNGQLTTASSDRVLGSVRYPENNFGTQWIESVTKNNKFIYGFDIFNGVLWRDSSNGIFPVSGRFEDAYGNGDYKMETYFRAKAEALALSGRAYTTVMTVWDERYDCLWVIFRDLVNEENDETIAFHEPSNRWITFADFTQTPADGYNVMLELDYWVLWGFENGIGFSFDEDTRFAIFDIETPPDVIAFSDEVELTYELLAPTIVVDCTVEMPLLTLQMSQFGPTIDTPFISLLPTALAWNADEYGSAYEEIITVDCSPISAYYVYTLTYNSGTGDNTPPSGLDALYFYDKSNGQQVGANTVLYDGMQIGVYPLTRHIGAYAQCYFMGFAYAGSPNKAVSLERNASTSNPTVRIQSLGGDSNPNNALQDVAGNGTCLPGSTQVDINFTCDHKDITDATAFMVFATIEIRDSQYGTVISTVGNNDVSTNETVITPLTISNLATTVPSGYWVYVYLSAYRTGVTPPTNVTALPSLLNLTYTLLPPTILVTYAYPSTPAETWLASQFGAANDRPFTVDTGASSQCRVVSFPSWITILDSGGNDLTRGHYIVNGETCALYPTAENLGAELSGTPIVFLNEYGDTFSMNVTHQAVPAVVPPTLTISTSDITGLDWHIGRYRVGVVLDATNIINLTATFDIATQSSGTYFTCYWRAIVNGVYKGNGNFTARNAFGVVDNLGDYEVQTALALTPGTVLDVADVITIYFAGNSI